MNYRWLALKVISWGKFPEDPSFQGVPTPEKVDVTEKQDPRDQQQKTQLRNPVYVDQMREIRALGQKALFLMLFSCGGYKRIEKPDSRSINTFSFSFLFLDLSDDFSLFSFFSSVAIRIGQTAIFLFDFYACSGQFRLAFYFVIAAPKRRWCQGLLGCFFN